MGRGLTWGGTGVGEELTRGWGADVGEGLVGLGLGGGLK